MDAAIPKQTVDTSHGTYCIVSYIAIPALTLPPGLLMRNTTACVCLSSNAVFNAPIKVSAVTPPSPPNCLHRCPPLTPSFRHRPTSTKMA